MSETTGLGRDEKPLDLRSLGEVDSPEVLRAALRRFRHRMLVRGLWIFLGVAILLGLRLAGPLRPSLADQIERSPGIQLGAVYRTGGVTVVVVRVADLGDNTGLHVVLADPAAGPLDDLNLWIRSGFVEWEFSSAGAATEHWYEVRVPATGRLDATVQHSVCPRGPEGGACSIEPQGQITIDLQAFGVDRRLWQ